MTGKNYMIGIIDF